MRMMQRVRREAAGLKISLEVEKSRPGIENLFAFANLLQVSPAFARSRHCSPHQLLARLRTQAPQADLVSTLGERGAIGLSRSGQDIHVEASAPGPVVDTLGAGDTFNAGLIDAGVRGDSLQAAMRFAARLAGSKCARSGLHGLTIPARPGDQGTDA